MINISKPYLEIDEDKNKAKLLTPIEIDGEAKEIFVALDIEYKDFLCAERGDAALVGILRYAMAHKHDIYLESPVTEELYYNITELLLPALKENDDSVYVPKIKCRVTSKKIEGNAVGTGCSCGVDSFYTILKHLRTNLTGYKLTHIVVFNSGSFSSIYNNFGIDEIKKSVWNRSAKVAEELGLPLIQVDSNIHQILQMSHLFSHTYLDSFMVFSMQGGFGKYYYASAYDYNKINLNNNLHEDTARIDPLLLRWFSTNSMQFILSGAECNRTDKIAFIAENKTVQKYLHVCATSGENCGRCEKCRRTLLAIDALGYIDDFGQTFPINDYKKNKENHYRFLCEKHYLNDEQYKEFYTKTFQLLYANNKALFDRYLQECKPKAAYRRIRILENFVEALRKQLHILDEVIDWNKLSEKILKKLKDRSVKTVAFYGDSAMRIDLQKVFDDNSIEIKYMVCDWYPRESHFEIIRTSEENLPEVDLIIITDFIATKSIRDKLNRIDNFGWIISAEELLK